MFIVFRSTAPHPIRTSFGGADYSCAPGGTVEIPEKFARLVKERGLPLEMVDGQAIPVVDPIGVNAKALIEKIKSARTAAALDRLGEEFERARGGFNVLEMKAIAEAGNAKAQSFGTTDDDAGDIAETDAGEGEEESLEAPEPPKEEPKGRKPRKG